MTHIKSSSLYIINQTSQILDRPSEYQSDSRPTVRIPAAYAVTYYTYILHMQVCIYITHVGLHIYYACRSAYILHMQVCIYITHVGLHIYYTCRSAYILHMQVCIYITYIYGLHIYYTWSVYYLLYSNYIIQDTYYFLNSWYYDIVLYI